MINIPLLLLSFVIAVLVVGGIAVAVILTSDEGLD